MQMAQSGLAEVEMARLARTADRFLDWMTRNGWRLDVALEHTPLSGALGFFWLAKAINRVRENNLIP
jgi:hypothetical protein